MSKIKKVIICILKWGLGFFFTYPFVYVLSTSLKTQQDYFTDSFTLFSAFSLENYINTIQSGFLWFFVNSIIVLVMSIGLIVITASLASYGLERINFKCNKWLSVLLVSGMMLPVHASLIPVFVLENHWGLYDTLLGASLPQVAFAIPISVFIMSQFMQGIPTALFEAARIDGAGHIQIFRKIALPLIQPALITIIIYNGVRIWNNFSFPLIFLQSRENYTIPLGLQDFYGEFSVNVPGILSAIFIATIPILILYFILQDKIEAGLTGGAVKE